MHDEVTNLLNTSKIDFIPEEKSYFYIPIVMASIMLALQLLTAGNYGFFGDELYFMTCGKRLAFGYVDHPPFVALIARLSLVLFGDSLLGLRFWAATAGAGTVLLTARITRDLGGSQFAQGLASLMILVSTVLPAIFSFMSMNAFDVLFCTCAVYLLICILKGASDKTWLLLGLIMGIGIMNKYTMFVFGFAVVVGLLLTKQRRRLVSPWPYLGGLIIILIFLPHVIWQITHDWPSLEFMKNAQIYKNYAHSPLGFLMQMLLTFNPVAFPVWMSGLLFLFFGKDTSNYRVLGIAVVIFLIVYMTQSSKTYYVVPILPLLLAAGAVAFERFIRRVGVAWLKPVFVSILVFGGATLLPLGVPLLPAERFIQYSKTIGLWEHIKMEKDQSDTLPLHFIYRFGWEELVEMVAEVYESLSEDEKAECGILASWYGPAGAIDHFGARFGLPNAISIRNNYWIWGPHNYTGEILITVGFGENHLRDFFGSVEKAAYFDHQYAYGLTICICREPSAPLAELWPRFKVYL